MKERIYTKTDKELCMPPTFLGLTKKQWGLFCLCGGAVAYTSSLGKNENLSTISLIVVIFGMII
ncbi:MAG: hypothetical protein KJ851_02230, partial [Nanoarchaeota archaeon]|nr:hypothetical protein [Nanoarchaeota archaeon]